MSPVAIKNWKAINSQDSHQSFNCIVGLALEILDQIAKIDEDLLYPETTQQCRYTKSKKNVLR